MKIENSSLTDSASITKNIFDNFYPSGNMVVKNTSFAKEGVSNKTLTSRTVSDALSGDALYRDAKFSLVYNNKLLNSSLNSLITSGAEAVSFSSDVLKIKDPDSSSGNEEAAGGEGGEDAESAFTLTGGAAFSRIMSSSILARRGSASLLNSSSRSALTDMSTATKIEEQSQVAGVAHGDGTYASESGLISAGSRSTALDSELTSGEKSWIIERGRLLKTKGVVADSQYLTGGFQFDIPDGLTNLKQTESFNPDATGGASVEQNVIDAGVQLAYIAPSIIELLLYLESKTGFRGNLGADKGANRASQTTQMGAAQNGSTLNDHVFGRAFDITEIASRDDAVNVNLVNEGNNVVKYRRALMHLLTILNAAPSHLLPDVISVHEDLAVELGVIPGNETINAPVKKQFSNLKYVNFQADSNHRTNIHLSFSSRRSGQYIGPDGALGAQGTFVAPAPVTPGGGGSFVTTPGTPANVNDPIYSKNFANDRQGTITAKQVFDLLRGTLFSDEAAAVYTAICERECNFKPGLLNPNTNGGDWSIGMFQVNMLMGAHGSKSYYLPQGRAVKFGWQLGYRNYAAEGVTGGNFDATVKAKYRGLGREACYQFIDPLCWTPMNQAYMLYTSVTNTQAPASLTPPERLGVNPEAQHIFWIYGDYGTKTAEKDTRPPYGWIRGVDFKLAVEVYKTTGKSPLILKDWVKRLFATQAKDSLAIPYVDGWLKGNVYPVGWNNGWEILPIIEYNGPDIYAGAAPVGAGSSGSTNGGARPTGYIPPINPGVPSDGGGGLGVPGLNGYAALYFARWECFLGRPYAAIHRYRYGIPWDVPVTKTMIGFRGDPYNFEPGTIVYDCSGFVVRVFREAGLDFTEYPFDYSGSQDFAKLPPQCNVTDINALQPLDIVVYSPREDVGHIVMINEVLANGTVTTLESTGGRGTISAVLNRSRATHYKRIFPTGYFNPGNIALV